MKVRQSALEEELQCAVCLGIVRDARVVPTCMHRFCATCIERFLRSSKESQCPKCRKHVPSRRSLREDPTFDALVRVVYGDLDEFEREEQQHLDMLNELHGASRDPAGGGGRASRRVAEEEPE